MAIRILLLTQWFDPEPTFKGLAFARDLVGRGFEVEVLTGFPNYPGGKIYKGYKLKLIQKEIINGVEITRVPLYASHNQSSIKRILNYSSFAFSALVYGLFIAKRPNLIYAYHPPLTTGITASLIRFFRRTPFVYDIQDMWPDTLHVTGMIRNQRIIKIIDTVCNWVYKQADHIVVLSPGFKKTLIDRKVPSEKISLIYNWADEQALAAGYGVLAQDFPLADKFRILFAGNMGKAQALDNILDAAALLQNSNSKAYFIMLGGGIEVDRLKLRAINLKLTNVVFLPPVPMSEVGTMLQAADVLLVHLRQDPLFEITIPSKTQAYMAVGKPILMAVCGDAADFIEKSGAGLTVEPENAIALANTIELLIRTPTSQLTAMGAQAKKYYDENLSLSVGVSKFEVIFTKLIVKNKK